jgi:hypothetical protein
MASNFADENELVNLLVGDMSGGVPAVVQRAGVSKARPGGGLPQYF